MFGDKGKQVNFKFKVGDVVIIKGQDLLMTVEEIDEDENQVDLLYITSKGRVKRIFEVNADVVTLKKGI